MGQKARTGEFLVFHATQCEECGADLTQQGAVKIHFSDGDRLINEANSSVEPSGRLLDPTGQVGIGQHSFTQCSACYAMLDEWEAEPSGPA